MAADFADEEFVKQDENDYDIIIIGAGLSGLTCAYHILKKQIGLDVLIIEANSEVGGRILQSSFNNTYHANSLQKHVTDLVTKLNINIDRVSNAETRQRIVYANNAALQILPKFYGAEVYNFFQRIEENALNLEFCNYAGYEEAKYLAETSVEQLLRKIVYFSYARSLCRAYICSTCAVRNLNDISALWFLVMLNGASGLVNRLKIMIGDSNRYFVQDGMSKITQTLLKYILQQDGEIRYVEPVNKVTLNDDRAYVSTEKNYFRCELVVVAVPPSVQNTIIIEPSVSPTNIETLYAPAENVFFNLVYKKPSSSSNSVRDIVTTWDSSNNLNIIYDATHGNTKELVLAGFLAEPNLTQAHKKGLLATLYDCYETFEPSTILRYKEYDQSLISDEINPGCPMSVLKPVSIMNFTNHTEASYERIFFASSEYAANWPGTIDGAIQVGENTAYEILWRIRPQALSFSEMSNIDNARIRIKSRTSQPVSLKVCVLQYLGILLHVAVLASFLKIAYH